MKYIKLFKTSSDYNDFANKDGDSWITPNICRISDEDSVVYNRREIIPSPDEEENPNIFTFSVGGIEYQAENEMTWRDWVNSQYNVDGFFIHNDSYVCYGSFCVSFSSPVRAVVEKPTLSTPVQLDNKITPGGNYLLEIRI